MNNFLRDYLCVKDYLYNPESFNYDVSLLKSKFDQFFGDFLYFEDEFKLDIPTDYTVIGNLSKFNLIRIYDFASSSSEDLLLYIEDDKINNFITYVNTSFPRENVSHFIYNFIDKKTNKLLYEKTVSGNYLATNKEDFEFYEYNNNFPRFFEYILANRSKFNNKTNYNNNIDILNISLLYNFIEDVVMSSIKINYSFLNSINDNKVYFFSDFSNYLNTYLTSADFDKLTLFIIKNGFGYFEFNDIFFNNFKNFIKNEIFSNKFKTCFENFLNKNKEFLINRFSAESFNRLRKIFSFYLFDSLMSNNIENVYFKVNSNIDIQLTEDYLIKVFSDNINQYNLRNYFIAVLKESKFEPLIFINLISVMIRFIIREYFYDPFISEYNSPFFKTYVDGRIKLGLKNIITSNLNNFFAANLNENSIKNLFEQNKLHITKHLYVLTIGSFINKFIHSEEFNSFYLDSYEHIIRYLKDNSLFNPMLEISYFKIRETIFKKILLDFYNHIFFTKYYNDVLSKDIIDNIFISSNFNLEQRIENLANSDYFYKKILLEIQSILYSYSSVYLYSKFLNYFLNN